MKNIIYYTLLPYFNFITVDINKVILIFGPLMVMQLEKTF